MRIPRVHSDLPLQPGAEMSLDDAAAHHVSTVLRLRQGDSIVLFHDGVEAAASIRELGRRGVRVIVNECRPCSRESPLSITLAQGISRGERMDYTIQKAVELGVTTISPIITERTTVKLDEARSGKRLEHWQRIIVGACEQSGRNHLPRLLPITTLAGWLARGVEGSAMLLRGDATTSILGVQPAGAITLLIGPEGGMTATEVASAEHAGYRAVSLGPRILRTETAALAAIAALQALYGDWR
jgi:16S rRNA (uracil1498-N3)-methyltransferase